MKGEFGEPWSLDVIDGDETASIHESQAYGCPTILASGVDTRYAARIIRCVNALAGVEDPEQFMADIRLVVTRHPQDTPVPLPRLNAAFLRIEAALRAAKGES